MTEPIYMFCDCGKRHRVKPVVGPTQIAADGRVMPTPKVSSIQHKGNRCRPQIEGLGGDNRAPEVTKA